MIRPVYVMQEIDGQNVTDAVVKKADGIVIRTKWSTIQPTKDKFDLKWLQGQLARAKKLSKVVQLEILAGDESPKWLANNGCQIYKFSGGQIPVYWDIDFQDWYVKLLSFIRKNLDWTMVTHFHLPGANNAEWHFSQFGSGGFYKVSGYSDSKMVESYKRLVMACVVTLPAHVTIVADIGDHTRKWTLTTINEIRTMSRIGFQMCSLKADTPNTYAGYTRIKDLSLSVPCGFEMIGPSVTRSGTAVARFGGTFDKAIYKANKTNANWLIVYQDDLRFMPF